MTELKKMLRELCSLATVSGYEKAGKQGLFELAGPYFDELYEDSFGNLVLVKKSQIENAPKLMIDAHFDEVGMLVSQIHEGGFLSVTQIGGLDTRVLPSAEVTVHGKKEIYGIISCIPPHIKGHEDDGAPKIEELYIDTGYTKEELCELVSLGDMVEFRDSFCELYGGCVVSKSLDDKACVCAVLDMARRADSSRLMFDLYVTVSAQEETGKNGARLVSYDIMPDIAIITDVNFALGDGIDETEAIELGKGAGVDISALTDVRLTRNIMRALDGAKIPYQRVCEPSRTSTNNDGISISGHGVRSALLSIPLQSMHTPSEVVSLSDIRSLSDILLEIAYTPKEAL